MTNESEQPAPPDRGDRDASGRRDRAFTLEEAFASVRPLGTEGDIERIIQEVKEERAERTMQKLLDVQPDGEP